MLLGLILAGGACRRWQGQNKALIEVDGLPMIEHVESALRPSCDRMVISANRDHDMLAAYSEHIVADDPAQGSGPLAGVKSAIMKYPDNSWLVVAVDLPFLSANTLAELARRRDHYLQCDGDRVLCVHLDSNTAFGMASSSTGDNRFFATLEQHGVRAWSGCADRAEVSNLNSPQDMEGIR